MTDTQRRLLIVDPDESQGKGIAHALQDLFSEIVLTQRPFEAIKRLNKEHFDVIITELEFNLIDGYEVIRNFNSLAPKSELVVMSTKIPENFHNYLAELGVRKFFEKPLELKELRHLMSEQNC